eukprot:Nitzschia sp. Nitz4//scaffold36_size144017//111892//113219//NITZ4_003110-RA/size144017-processed-gene-0.89-mRNA-1//-1//CDS//3329549528//8696//frame0
MGRIHIAKAVLVASLVINACFLLPSLRDAWRRSFDNAIKPGCDCKSNHSSRNGTSCSDSLQTEPSGEPVSIIVDLTGEFGNHLHHIAHGRAIQSMLHQEHGIQSELIFRRHSNDAKYPRAQRQLKQCFPNLRDIKIHDSQSSSIPSQKSLDRMQQTILGDSKSKRLFLNSGSTLEDTRLAIQELVQARQDIDTRSLAGGVNQTHGISLPFIHTSNMINREFMDMFYDEYREFFEFDEEACCGVAQPDKDEIVFHFRNFLGEVKQGKKTGLEEVTADMLATQTLASSTLKKVAIATRFSGRKATDEYHDTLSSHGFDVRYLTANTEDNGPTSAMEDFCAMRRASELVGTVRSTFVVWAALLGNPEQTARLYSIDSPWTRKKSEKTGNPVFRTYNWTHPELQRRIHFELYHTDD